MFKVLFEDNHLIAVSKDNNTLVHSDKTGDTTLEEEVKAYIKEKYNKPGNVFLGVIHRIDRPVSGIVLFAKTSKALGRMNELFKHKQISKSYYAIVENIPHKHSATLTHFITRNHTKNKSFVSGKEVANSKQASLCYTHIGSSERYHLLHVDLHTGRHHQIRAQLSSIGCCIKGDLKYGARRSNPDGGISLHAYSVSFTHPVTKEKIDIIAAFPQETLWNEFSTMI
ncbi:MAG: RluA family pseudouridine synthase [Bacteroidales bacterium]|jgi:23S rRNA pseudouridine1911/1915/1917 synthase|nr:RluA family pseudouridine synthase [Bacteroidales bacterium]